MVPGRATLIYDGACGFCSEVGRALARRDAAGALELIPLGHPDVARRWPALSPEALDRAMHLVLPDGRILAGADAVPEILRRLPRWRHAAWLFRVPGVPAVARRVYGMIARNRHRLGCRTSQGGRAGPG
jgi:predicted DCC family thiol-disulfide oxidoreductase YuxK